MRRLHIDKVALKKHESTYAYAVDSVLALIALGRPLYAIDRRYAKTVHLKVLIPSFDRHTVAGKYFRLVKRLNDRFRLLCASPGDLELVRCRFDRFEELLGSLAAKGWRRNWEVELKEAKKHIALLFNYEKFSLGEGPEYSECGEYIQWTDSSDEWSAWYFLKSLNVGSCSYCNGDGVFSLLLTHKLPGSKISVGRVGKHSRSPFDHFYGHSEYPALGISLYNLVPSCTRCNTNIKGARKQSADKHFHPYLDSLCDHVRFYILYKRLPFGGLPYDDDFCVIIRRRMPIVDVDKARRAEESSKFFHLEEVYDQTYKKIVGDAVRRALASFDAYRCDLEAQYKGISNMILDRMIFGASLSLGDENSYPFAVMIRDVNNQLSPTR